MTKQQMNRREFLQRLGLGAGAAVAMSMLGPIAYAGTGQQAENRTQSHDL